MAGINNRATPSGEYESPGNGFSAQRTVLVVEDHDDSRSLLKTFLELSDFVVLEAENGESAIKLALTKHPDLILMDLTMPGVDGLMATRVIREEKDLRQMPIIFLSGNAQVAGQQAAAAAGCNGYLIKPIDLDEVLSVVRRCLQSNPDEA